MLCVADEFLHPRPMPRVLFPANGSVVESGPFEVIALAAEKEDGSFETLPLQVDGKDHPWQSYALPVCIAHLELPPGEHYLSLGIYDVMFFVAGSEITPPKDWPVAKAHAGAEAWQKCGLCHETTPQDGQTVLGMHKGWEACSPCHPASDVAAKHNHSEPPLRDCASCHAVHGATEEHLLRAPQKQLCATCHR